MAGRVYARKGGSTTPEASAGVPPGRHGTRLPAASSEGRLALQLGAGGFAFAVLCILLNAWLDVSIGPLHVIAALALVGLLAVIAGGVFALIAIVRRDERSAWVSATLLLSLLALLVVVAQVAFDVP